MPVAWAISNREDATLLVEYLKSVHACVGELAAKYFMSDCAEQYFNAWCAVFGEHNTQKLLCSWHVDRAWRSSLNDHVSNMQDRIEIYHEFCILMQDTKDTVGH